ncbi:MULTISPECIES: hypothetical protein [unclassified Amycolatopsis]|uniref:hypothetical protein n=1 Tax=unclassified Amycolatopsis TaxID=2618356 RepID=UPI001C6A4D59|nr:hypothetical protein [Amycolatopsis sp. DSM 110486]QYN20142.1 hypothetical protein K1T34_47620 [Amycolatopsis sp. DSM 110486]
MADPTPFPSTVTGASAGLVAIVGGLPVNRFVGLDSEQQGAQAVLEHAEQRLATARARARDARQEWTLFWIADFLANADVLAAIQAGTRQMDVLVSTVDVLNPLTASELQPHFQAAGDEYDRAREFIDAELEPAELLSSQQWRQVDWTDFRSLMRDRLPQIERSYIWETAFSALVDARAEERGRQEEQEREERRGAGSVLGFAAANMAYFPSPSTIGDAVSRTLNSNQAARRVEDVRSRLATGTERADQQREDAEAEVVRLRERRDAIVRPDTQLWIGFGVLLYPTIVSIVLPVLAMSGGPTTFTSGIKALGWLFGSSLLVLVLYMAHLATRLSIRGRRRAAPRSTGAASISANELSGPAASDDAPETVQTDGDESDAPTSQTASSDS